MKAAVTDNGAVLLGRSVVCDAHARRPVRVVTHAHWDHLIGLKKSLSECRVVLMTPPTKDIVEVLRGKELTRSSIIGELEYQTPYEYSKELITFFDAGHILGSSQVLLETEAGERILYTGDVRLSEASVILSDLLVIEATYGNPKHVRRFKDQVNDELVELVHKLLRSGGVYIFGYHGKLQEALQILSSADFSVPILVEERASKLCRIFEKYGVKFKNYISTEGKDGKRLLHTRKTFIAFFHMKKSDKISSEKNKIYLSGWEFKEPVRRESENEWVVALSDHSDFDELLKYVEQSSPDFVITDNYRVGDARTLAAEITKRLGIPAQPMP